MAELRFPSWLRLRLAQEGMLICFSPLLKGKVRDASASAQRGHKGGKWVFSELKNEPVLSHFYCITSCLLAHCHFGRFFWRPFPYTLVEATPSWRTHGESSPLSKATSRVCAETAHASSGMCQTLVVCERGYVPSPLNGAVSGEYNTPVNRYEPRRMSSTLSKKELPKEVNI